MVVETCIRKGLGLKAHRVVAVREQEDALVAEIERIGRRRLRCSGCGGVAKHTKGRRPWRYWHDLRLRDHPLVLSSHPYRVCCPRCGVRVEDVLWAARWARVTTALARAVALLARQRSSAEVTAHFGLDWKTVAAIVCEAVATGLRRHRWRPLRVLGIDEVSRAKGQRNLTLVYDLARRRLVWAGEGRTRDTIDGFFRWLGRPGDETHAAERRDTDMTVAEASESLGPVGARQGRREGQCREGVSWLPQPRRPRRRCPAASAAAVIPGLVRAGRLPTGAGVRGIDVPGRGVSLHPPVRSPRVAPNRLGQPPRP